MKLRNKLILSCAALAAVATTAVSTTYAWYTSNEKVTAQNITGASADSGSDLLMIADGMSSPTTEITTLTSLDWKTNLTDVTESSAELTPLAYETTNSNLQPITVGASASAVAASTTEASTGYLKFVIYLKNVGQTAKTVTMKVTSLTNETKDNGTVVLPAKQIIDATSNRTKIDTTATSITTYKVDVLRTLCADVEIQSVTNGVLGSTIDNETVYDLEPAATLNTDNFNGGDAHAYYNAVMTQSPISAADITAANTANAAFTQVNATNGNDIAVQVPAGYSADNYLKLTFKVFINGWDKACFDAVQGQNFKMALSFNIKQQNNG